MLKMPTADGILTFISMINTASESFKARKIFIFQHLPFMSFEISCSVELKVKNVYNFEARPQGYKTFFMLHSAEQ